MQSSLRRRRRRRFKFVLLVASLLLVEGGSRALLALKQRIGGQRVIPLSQDYAEQRAAIEHFLEPTDPHKSFAYDAELGWCSNPGATNEKTHINAQGIRRAAPVPAHPAPGKTRVSVFGDSFAYCTEVTTGESWPAVLESRRGDLEVLNLGVAAYGPGQVYLRYERQADQLDSDLVLFTISPPDIGRAVNRYRRFLSRNEGFLVKPRFVLRPEGELELVPNPLTSREAAERYRDDPTRLLELGERDYHYEPWIYENPLYDVSGTVRLASSLWIYAKRRHLDPRRLYEEREGGQTLNPDSEAFALTVALLEECVHAAERRGQAARIVILPNKESVASVCGGGPAMCATLRTALEGAGLEVWDGTQAFADARGDIEQLFAPYGHYSPAGNRLVAGWLASQL